MVSMVRWLGSFNLVLLKQLGDVQSYVMHRGKEGGLPLCYTLAKGLVQTGIGEGTEVVKYHPNWCL